jgi:hypothetical protein
LYRTYSGVQEAKLFCHPEKDVTAMTEISAELQGLLDVLICQNFEIDFCQYRNIFSYI